MLGVILRLLAAGDGDRGAGDSLKNLTTRWLVFGIAGIIFASGIAFGVLAGFWALESRTRKPGIVSRDHGGDFDLSGLVDRVHRLWNYRRGENSGSR